jgi:plasmid stability protein
MLYFRAKTEPTLTDLSIKDVPEEQVAALRERAKRNHRSLQGELRAMIDELMPAVPKKKMTIEELSAYAKSLGLTSKDEATQWIREDGDR